MIRNWSWHWQLTHATPKLGIMWLVFWALNKGCYKHGLKKGKVRLPLQTKLYIVELPFNSYWWQWKINRKQYATASQRHFISSLVLAGVRWLLHISLVFSWGSRNNYSKLITSMSSRRQRNEKNKVDGTLHRILLPKRRQTREYHNITRCCKMVCLCDRQNWLYTIL
jgi:hypothetical protein